MGSIDRRTFLRQTTMLAAGGLGLAAGPFRALVSRAAFADPKFAADNAGYGPLVPAVDLTTGQVLLHLPKGFQYRSFGRVGETMSDGHRTPGRHDGMAAFPAPGNRVRLVRNHEVFFDPGAVGPESTAYDRRSGGGTTTLEVTRRAEHVESWLSLNGTNANCAGGATPWRTWITCEETPNGPDANVAFTGATLVLEEQHGFLFEVPARRGPGELERGEPIRKAGRFAHEAVALDPATGTLYETEDNFARPSGFFRYIPPENPFAAKRVLDGGRLQVLSVIPPGATGPVSLDLSADQTPGVTYRAAWIDIENPDPTFPTGMSNDDAASQVFLEGESKGAARFSRLEGISYANRTMYLISTEGGGPFPGGNGSSGFGEGFGQVWAYHLDHETLTLVFESPGKDVLDLPDNVVVSPRRKSLLLCEDSADANMLRGLTRDGLIFDFALNVFPGRQTDEFAGATFSPDTQTLFVNLQAAGVTFAIWGPWERGLL